MSKVRRIAPPGEAGDKNEFGGGMVVEVAEARALFEPRGHVSRRQSVDPAGSSSACCSSVTAGSSCGICCGSRRAATTPRKSLKKPIFDCCASTVSRADSVRARNYLFRTATNLVRDNYRRRTARCEQQHVALEDLQLEAEDSALGPHRRFAARGRHRDRDSARRLQPRPRQAFVMHFGHGDHLRADRDGARREQEDRRARHRHDARDLPSEVGTMAR